MKISNKVKEIMKEEYMGVEELSTALRTFPVFGELVLEITEEIDGYKINAWDRDLAIIEDTLNEVDMSCSVLVLYTNKDKKINFINNPYNSITKSNVEFVRFVCDFIGKTITNIQDYVKKEL